MTKLPSKRRDDLPSDKFADPKHKKLPLTDKSHVDNAAARVNQTKGMSAEEKAAAKRKIEAAQKRYGEKK